MTLNDILKYALDNGVDFDALVTVPYQDACDVASCDTQYFAGSDKTGLVLRII